MRRYFLPVWVLLLSSLFAINGPAWGQQVPVCSRDSTNPYIPDSDACVTGGFRFPVDSDFRDPATANNFSLSPPGARSLAMGGAFLGLADDATAAYTNPAGLTNLAVGGSEVAVEIRGAQYTSSFADQGHFNSTPGLGTHVTDVGQDFIDGIQLGKADGNTTGLSFLSYGFVLPGGVTMAVYRHELGNFQSAFEAQGPFNDDNCSTPAVITGPNGELAYGQPEGRECELFRVQPSRSSIDLEIVNWGASGAYAFDVGSESNLSVGLGFSYYEAAMNRSAETFDLCRFDQFDPMEPLDPNPNMDDPFFPGFPCTQSDARSRMPGGLYGPADYSPDNAFETTTEVANDTAFGINLGFLWKIGREQRISVGGVFRQGAEFDTVQKIEIPPTRFNPAEPIETVGGSLTVPDVFGLGVAYRSTDGKTKLTFDWNRILYSQTLGDFTRNLGQGCNVDMDPCPPEEVEDFSNSYTLDDIDQFHFGFERIVLVVESLFVGSARFGAWSEPDHTPRYTGNDDDLLALLGREQDDELHLSVGFGLVIKEDYQLDFGANFSDVSDTYSFSLVKFF